MEKKTAMTKLAELKRALTEHDVSQDVKDFGDRKYNITVAELHVLHKAAQFAVEVLEMEKTEIAELDDRFEACAKRTYNNTLDQLHATFERRMR